MQEVKLGPCIIPDEPVGKHVLEQVAVIKDPDGYTFEVRYDTMLSFSSSSNLLLDVPTGVDVDRLRLKYS